MVQLTSKELEAGLDHIRLSPKECGSLELIVRRPDVDKREVLKEGILNLEEGLVGDDWKNRPSSKMENKAPHPEMQLTLMNSRLIHLLTQNKNDWSLAGDQLFVDFDLSLENIPAKTKLNIGETIIEITAQDHSGCGKFAERFGRDAMIFVNSIIGKKLRLRGVNAKVTKGGIIKTGDKVTKI